MPEETKSPTVTLGRSAFEFVVVCDSEKEFDELTTEVLDIQDHYRVKTNEAILKCFKRGVSAVKSAVVRDREAAEKESKAKILDTFNLLLAANPKGDVGQLMVLAIERVKGKAPQAAPATDAQEKTA